VAAEDAVRELVHVIPKAELHVHLEGSIAASTALRLAARNDVRLPAQDEAGLRRAYSFAGFDDFIRLYIAISRCFSSVDDFADAVDDVAGALAEQNVVYAEMTVTPMTHVVRGVAEHVVLEGLRLGRARARARGVDLRWVFDIVRSFPDQAEGTLAMALAGRQDGVVALGLGGPERAGTPTELDSVFERARAAGLASVPHAGETAGPESVRIAVERLGAQRIGHGVRALEDPDVIQMLRDRDVKLEVCPSSNVALSVSDSWATHPLPKLMAAGVACSLATDDPALFGTDLEREYRMAATTYGWGEDQLLALMGAAVDHAVCDEETKRRLRAAQRGAGRGRGR
jgi:aminodeoxyfutalosine deaminase